MGLRSNGIDPTAEARLLAYTWPGSVRELRNVMERALILFGGERIGPEQLPKEWCAAVPCMAREGCSLC